MKMRSQIKKKNKLKFYAHYFKIKLDMKYDQVNIKYN